MDWSAARRLRGCSRSVGRLTLLTASLALLASDARAQALPAGFDQGIFELRVARAAAETMQGVLAPSGVVLLPIERVVALTGMPVTRADSSIAVERARGGGVAAVRYATRELVDRGVPTPLRADELLRVDGVWYLATPRIGTLLGATVDSDLGQLAVTLTRTPPFPVEQMAARAQRTAAAGAGPRGSGSASTLPPFVARSGGAVVDWNLSSSGGISTFGGSSGSVRGSAALLGGDLTAGVGMAVDGGGGTRATDQQWSYRRGLPGNAIVRQVQVGDILAGGAQLRSLRGVTLSNARFAADPFFSNVPIDLSLPAGWQYEVYQDGRLIGFSEPGMRDPLYVSLRYGNTPVQVRLVSPTGDESIQDFSYLIPQTQQQPGRLEYSVGAGQCTSLCESTAYGSASYGVLPWLSVSAGAERQTVAGTSRTLPEGGVSVLTYSGWNAQVQGARESFERATLLYGGLGRLVGSASYTRTHSGAGQPSVIASALGTRWLLSSLLQLRPSHGTGSTGWRIDNAVEGASSSGAERTRTALTADRTRASYGVSYESDRTRGLHEVGVSVLSVITHGRRASSVLGAVHVDGGSLRAAELSTSVQAGYRGSAAITTRWQQDAGVALTLGYNASLGASRVTSRFAASRRQGGTLAATASGSVGLDGAHPTWFEGPGVGLAGMTGRVYYDIDGNGLFGGPDLPAPGIRVVVNGAQTRSDSTGEYHLWNVIPYEAADIAVDTLAFIDPSWTLQRGRTVVRATPGMFNRMDFPLVRTRELAGQLTGDSTVATVAGVGLLLTPSDGGVAMKISTFSDGTFYVSRVRPGTYRLTVAQSSLNALGATATPGERLVVVTVAADEPVLDVPPIQLRRRASPAPTP